MAKTIEVYYFNDKIAEYLFSDDFKQIEEVVFCSEELPLKTDKEILHFLKSRVVDPHRPNRKEMLGVLGDTFFPWYKEIGKTLAFDADDFYWVRIPSEMTRERQKWKIEDFHFKLNSNANSVYF